MLESSSSRNFDCDSFRHCKSLILDLFDHADNGFQGVWVKGLTILCHDLPSLPGAQGSLDAERELGGMLGQIVHHWSWFRAALPRVRCRAVPWAASFFGRPEACSPSEVFVETSCSLNTRAECSRVEERGVLRHWGDGSWRWARRSHWGILSDRVDFGRSCLRCVWTVPWRHSFDRAVSRGESHDGTSFGTVCHSGTWLFGGGEAAFLVSQRGFEAVLPLQCCCHLYVLPAYLHRVRVKFPDFWATHSLPPRSREVLSLLCFGVSVFPGWVLFGWRSPTDCIVSTAVNPLGRSTSSQLPPSISYLRNCLGEMRTKKWIVCFPAWFKMK